MPRRMHHVHFSVNNYDARGAFAKACGEMHSAHMNLRAIRERRGFERQADLAEAIDVDQATVARMEALSPRVSFRHFLRAAEVLGVSLAEIFADDRSEAEVALVRYWRSLPERERDMWSEHLRIAAGKDRPEG